MRDKLTAGVLFSVFQAKLKLNYTYINYLYRSQSQNAFDLMISRKVFDWLEVTIKTDNLFDYYFEEVPGIPAPRRMISARVDIQL